jgi:TPR repeat protein
MNRKTAFYGSTKDEVEKKILSGEVDPTVYIYSPSLIQILQNMLIKIPQDKCSASEILNQVNFTNISSEFQGFEVSPPKKREASIGEEKAAEAGDVYAMVKYGMLLAEGFEGSPSNKREASVWYKKAAEAGEVCAMLNYGI